MCQEKLETSIGTMKQKKGNRRREKDRDRRREFKYDSGGEWDVYSVTKKFKLEKAASADGIMYEVWKYGSMELKKY